VNECQEREKNNIDKIFIFFSRSIEVLPSKCTGEMLYLHDMMKKKVDSFVFFFSYFLFRSFEGERENRAYINASTEPLFSLFDF